MNSASWKALEGVNNYRIAVKEQGDDIIFFRKIVKEALDCTAYGCRCRCPGIRN